MMANGHYDVTEPRVFCVSYVCQSSLSTDFTLPPSLSSRDKNDPNPSPWPKTRENTVRTAEGKAGKIDHHDLL